MDLLIKNGHVIDPKNNINAQLDLLIKDGKISKIAPNIPAHPNTIDASGKLVTPGLVDMHCHLRSPGQEHKEDIATGTLSAAAGGFTSVACMPNTAPAVDSPDIVRFIRSQPASVNVYPIGAITKGLQGRELADYAALLDAGIVALSDDGCTVADPALMRDAMINAKALNLLITDHCEDGTLIRGGVINDGPTAQKLNLPGINRSAEETIIARDILLAEKHDIPIHIAHVSTRGGAQLIREAKKRGVAVTCETCPHFFTLTEAACETLGTLAKINPPLRTDDDLSAIKEALCDGTIDVIATDHAPHAAGEKSADFLHAPFGAVGFETAFGLGYTYLVRPGLLKLPDFIAKMTYIPAEILRIPKGTLSIGTPADVAIFDTQEEYTVRAKNLSSKSKNTPFDGFKLYGKPICTTVNGEIKFKGD